MAWPRGSGMCSASRTTGAPSRAIWLMSSGVSLSKIIHSESARMNTAAGVGEAKGTVSRSPSLLRRTVMAAESPVICGAAAAFASAAASVIGWPAGSGLGSAFGSILALDPREPRAVAPAAARPRRVRRSHWCGRGRRHDSFLDDVDGRRRSGFA